MNIEELKRLAESATPGPWKVDKWLGARSDEWIVAYDAGDKGRGLAIVNSIYSLSDAKYIAAANPAAILELIRQRDEWKRQAESIASDFNMVEHDRDEWKARYEFSVTVRDSLERQRDELLTALREIAEWTERYTTPGHPISTAARAVIAKVEG